MLEETFPCRLFLGPDKILGPMSTSYVTAVVNPEVRGVIVPVSPILVVYTAGNGRTVVPYGGNPHLQIGYPGDFNALYVNSTIGINEEVSQIYQNTGNGDLGNAPFTEYVNQPLVISFADASTTYGPIHTSSLASGGSGYAANDEFQFDDDTTATGKVLTVTPITGVVLTYSILTVGTALIPGVSTTTATIGVGTGLTINLTTVQGNGSLYLEFDCKIIRIPLLASINPSWPVVY